MLEPAGVLVVVAHPDDEVLGAGGSMSLLASRGTPVRTCILSGAVDARAHRPSDEELLRDTLAAASQLGCGVPIMGQFPNIRMNMVPHLDLVQFIEAAIVQTGATTLFTHHPSDLNDDHRQVSAACQAAARLAQRRTDVQPLAGLYFMEVPSSTDWSFPGVVSPFQPTAFYGLDEELISTKLAALAEYRGVMRPHPHPRSEASIRSLAMTRGSQAGYHFAEAFQAAFVDLGVAR